MLAAGGEAELLARGGDVWQGNPGGTVEGLGEVESIAKVCIGWRQSSKRRLKIEGGREGGM